jgi:hypothetical protein
MKGSAAETHGGRKGEQVSLDSGAASIERPAHCF